MAGRPAWLPYDRGAVLLCVPLSTGDGAHRAPLRRVRSRESPYDSTATEKRLLDAAFDELAERGLAGARVDAIAMAAAANKQAIYAYYGSKDGLSSVGRGRRARGRRLRMTRYLR